MHYVLRVRFRGPFDQRNRIGSIDRRFRGRRWWDCVYTGRYWGDQAISPTHDISDIRGILGIVAESAPEGGHSAIYRVGVCPTCKPTTRFRRHQANGDLT